MNENNWKPKEDGNAAQPGGLSRFDPETFIGDVVNSVNDLALDGFNNMEEFAAQTLDLKTDDERRALKVGLDSAYHRVQDNIEESFGQWEAGCRDIFAGLEPNETESVPKAQMNGGRGPEDAEERAVDSELESLRGQLIAAHREGARMRRELVSLERQLALRREVLTDVKSVEANLDDAVVEDIIKSASLLKETMVKASRIHCGELRPMGSEGASAGASPEPGLEEEIAALSSRPDVSSEDAALVKMLG